MRSFRSTAPDRLRRKAVHVRDGRARATLTVPASIGDLAAGVAFVRDGAMQYATRDIRRRRPGSAAHDHAAGGSAGAYGRAKRPRSASSTAGSHEAGTVAVRLGDGIPARGADFVDAPDSLASGRDDDAESGVGRPGVACVGGAGALDAGDIFAFDRPRAAEKTDASLAVAAPRALVWRDRSRTPVRSLDVTLPQREGQIRALRF